jgi:Co/Zn/Cd efflux system component
MIMFDPDRGPPAIPSGAILEPRRRRTLWTVAALNGTVALTAFAAGRIAGAHALEAAALVSLGAALTHGLHLSMAGASLRRRQAAALSKASVLTGAGIAVLGGTVQALLHGPPPSPQVMGGVSLAIVSGHLASLLLLLPHRDEPAFRGALASARQGVIGHLLVVLAALAVWVSGSDWPDLIVAANLAALFLLSALQVLRQAWIEWQTGEDHGALASHGFHKDFA